jgi:hypothetical protein
LRAAGAAGDHDPGCAVDLAEGRLDQVADLVDLVRQAGVCPRGELPGSVLLLAECRAAAALYTLTRSAAEAASIASYLLPDIQDEHGGVTHDEHVGTGISGARECGDARGGAGVLTLAVLRGADAAGCSW